MPSDNRTLQDTNAGYTEDPAGPEFFNGIIDEVELFSRALSAEEVAALLEAGEAGKCKDDTFVDIDIRPFSKSNTINPKTRGLLLVAVLGSNEFDAIRTHALRCEPSER